MRWSVEDKLKFIKQYKKYGTVRHVDGCTTQTMRNRVKNWVTLYNLYGINGIRHSKCRAYSLKEKMKAIELIKRGLSYSEVAFSIIVLHFLISITF